MPRDNPEHYVMLRPGDFEPRPFTLLSGPEGTVHLASGRDVHSPDGWTTYCGLDLDGYTHFTELDPAASDAVACGGCRLALDMAEPPL